MLSRSQKVISIVMKCAIAVSVAAGILLCFNGVAQGGFMAGKSLFLYFTIQSNIAIALVCLAGIPALLCGKVSRGWAAVKLMFTVAITLTGCVFCFMLAPTLSYSAWTPANILTHVLVPILSVADYFFVARELPLKRPDFLFSAIPPIFYVIFAAIGFVKNWDFGNGQNYPYFFLNWGSPAGAFGFMDRLPFLGSVWWILILAVFVLGVGYLYTAAAMKIRKKNMS